MALRTPRSGASGVLAESWETLAELLKGLNSKFLLFPQCESSKNPLEDGTTLSPSAVPEPRPGQGWHRGCSGCCSHPSQPFTAHLWFREGLLGHRCCKREGRLFFWGVLSVFLNSSSGVTLMEGGITGPSPCPVSVNCLQDFPLSPTFPVQLLFHSRLPYWHDTVGEHCQS